MAETSAATWVDNKTGVGAPTKTTVVEEYKDGKLVRKTITTEYARTPVVLPQPQPITPPIQPWWEFPNWYSGGAVQLTPKQSSNTEAWNNRLGDQASSTDWMQEEVYRAPHDVLDMD